jgi:hypothetical protein
MGRRDKGVDASRNSGIVPVEYGTCRGRLRVETVRQHVPVDGGALFLRSKNSAYCATLWGFSAVA